MLSIEAHERGRRPGDCEATQICCLALDHSAWRAFQELSQETEPGMNWGTSTTKVRALANDAVKDHPIAYPAPDGSSGRLVANKMKAESRIASLGCVPRLVENSGGASILKALVPARIFAPTTEDTPHAKQQKSTTVVS